MDLQMPAWMVEAIVRIRALDPRARIIVLTTYRGDVRAVRALQAGASAYLLKDMLRHELVDTIRMVAGGAVRRFLQRWRQHRRACDQTACTAQTEVLRYVAGGLSNKRIGERMNFGADGEGAHEKPDGQARRG